jgi:hypothetical protein
MKRRELHGVPTFAAAWTMLVPGEQGVLHKFQPCSFRAHSGETMAGAVNW